MTRAMPCYRRLVAAPEMEIVLEGRRMSVPAGRPLLPSLMALGVEAWPGTGRLAQPLCLMGVCFQCVATVDGRSGRRLCRTPAKEGMSVRGEAAHE